jgi:hypothetical protein
MQTAIPIRRKVELPILNRHMQSIGGGGAGTRRVPGGGSQRATRTSHGMERKAEALRLGLELLRGTKYEGKR